MDTGVIVAIVVGALILLAIFALLGSRGRKQKRETRRGEAREIRREAEVNSAEADRVSAEADQRAASARHEEALARKQAVEADDAQRLADERHAEADERDPDVKTGGLFRRGGGKGRERDDRRSEDQEQPEKVAAPAGYEGGESAGDAGSGVVHERVHREHDPQSQEIRSEEVEERR